VGPPVLVRAKDQLPHRAPRLHPLSVPVDLVLGHLLVQVREQATE
jgi:hypothetical protein